MAKITVNQVNIGMDKLTNKFKQELESLAPKKEKNDKNEVKKDGD